MYYVLNLFLVMLTYNENPEYPTVIFAADKTSMRLMKVILFLILSTCHVPHLFEGMVFNIYDPWKGCTYMVLFGTFYRVLKTYLTTCIIAIRECLIFCAHFIITFVTIYVPLTGSFICMILPFACIIFL